MKQKKGLRTIQTLAESTETKHSRVVSRQRSTLREEEDRLAQLEQYHSEYQSLEHSPGVDSSIHFVRGRRNFVQKLNAAIESQRRLVAQLREQLDVCVMRWNDARAKALSLQKYAERMTTQENRRVTRREQTETDDMGRKMRSEHHFG